MTTKTYTAPDSFRDVDDAIVWVEGPSGAHRHPLSPRFDLRQHSPTGFAWGYAGSGPAQLAIALLADALGDDARAERHYQQFKFRVVSKWSQSRGWTITQEEVVKEVERIEQAIDRRADYESKDFVA
jgi:hypothetical protein